MSAVVGIITLLFIPYSLATVQVDVISLLPFNLDVAPALLWTGAAFSQAVETVNQNYAPYLNLTLTLLYNTSHKACADIIADSGDMLAKYRYRNGASNSPETVNAFVASTCTDLVGMQSFAKEWDWLLFNNGLTKDEFLDKKVNPTALAIGGTYPGFSLFILDFLASNRWRHITILLQSPTVSTFYPELANDLRNRYKQKENGPVSLEVFKFTVTNQSMTSALEYGKKQSRVILILAPASIAISLLMLSHAMGFDEKGEYVFINVQPLQQSSYGKATDFDNPRPEFLKAFQSMIYIGYRSSGVELQDLNDELLNRTKIQYNRTYAAGEEVLIAAPFKFIAQILIEMEPLDSYAVKAAYDIIDLVAITVNETLSSSSQTAGTPISGRHLADLMSNRTFSTNTGQYYINSAGARYLDMDVFGFTNNSSTQMERLGWWSWATRRMTWSNTTKIWPTESGREPFDVPLCGFSENDGPCSVTSANDKTLKTVLPIIFLIGAAAVAVLLYVTFNQSPHFDFLSIEALFIPQQITRLPGYSMYYSIQDFNQREELIYTIC